MKKQKMFFCEMLKCVFVRGLYFSLVAQDCCKPKITFSLTENFLPAELPIDLSTKYLEIVTVKHFIVLFRDHYCEAFYFFIYFSNKIL